MANLQRLPPELLEVIYLCLGSIDDVHHFARACKETSEVIQRPQIYVKVMRSVIGYAPQHRYDIFLCELLQIHREMVRYYAKNEPNTGPNIIQLVSAQSNQLDPASFEGQLLTLANSKCLTGCKKCLPDDRIYEILARYQGLRVLEHEWLRRTLDDNDLLPMEYDMKADTAVQMHSLLQRRYEAYEDGIYLATGPESVKTWNYNSFNADQRNRFHAALISVWAYNEIRWVFTQYTDQGNDWSNSFGLKVLEACKRALEERIGTSVLDEADRWAMWQFLYQHLLPVYGSFLSDQDCSQLPLTFPSNQEGSPHRTRMLQLFLLAGQTYLQPPDLIDLILRYRTSRKRPYPELKVPRSTQHFRRPSNILLFEPGIDYDSQARDQNTLRHMWVITRATINQTVERPFPHSLVRLGHPTDPGCLFNVRDQSAAYFREAMMKRYEVGTKYNDSERTKKIRANQPREWGKVWWAVWWWANSEDKARAKIQRWAEVKSKPDN